MNYKSLWIAFVVLLALAVTSPLLAKPSEGPPPGSIKLAMAFKAQGLQGLSFEIKPTVIVLNDKKATIKVHEDKESGLLVSLTVHPKRLGQDLVDLSINFLVRQGEHEVARQTRFVTILGQNGLFSVSDNKSGEHLEIQVTPTLTK